MLVALGELTQDPELWERAWELSGGRYARAKVWKPLEPRIVSACATAFVDVSGFVRRLPLSK